MSLRYKKLSAAIALLVTFAIAQTYIGISFAATSSAATAANAASPQLMGSLTTSNNKPITVNGASAVSGASIPSPATIETPPGVGATVRIPGLGSLCIAADTKINLVFDQQGKLITITLTEGCVVLRTNNNVGGAINSAQGTIGKINDGGSLDVCMKAGEAPTVGQGAALNAGAGAAALDCGAAGAAAIPPGGLPPAATAAFIGGGILGLYLLFRGGNPSESGL